MRVCDGGGGMCRNRVACGVKVGVGLFTRAHVIIQCYENASLKDTKLHIHNAGAPRLDVGQQTMS